MRLRLLLATGVKAARSADLKRGFCTLGSCEGYRHGKLGLALQLENEAHTNT